MRSGLLAGAIALGVLATGSTALAEPSCAELSTKVTTLDKAGKLTDARRAAGECTTVCGDAGNTVAADKCQRQYDELDASRPSVVFEVFDATGTPTSQASVSVKDPSGQMTPVTKAIDAQPYWYDPGIYTFVVTLNAGGAPKETTISLKRGTNRSTQNTPVSVSFKADVVAPPPGGGTPPPDTGGGGVPAWAWAVGGVGLATLITGGVFIGLSVDGQNQINAHCPSSPTFESADPDYTATTCADGGSIQSTNNLYQALAGVFGGIGGAAVIVGIVGIATAPKAKPRTATTVEFIPVAGAGVVGGLVRGAF